MVNVFTYFPYAKRYYILNPWFFVRQCWRNLKAAWQRATKGYADRDVWSLDDYLLALMPRMLDRLRETSHGYCATMGSEEEWFRYLNEVSTHLRNAAKEGDWDNLDEWNKVAAYKESEIKIALSMLAEHWFALWD